MRCSCERLAWNSHPPCFRFSAFRFSFVWQCVCLARRSRRGSLKRAKRVLGAGKRRRLVSRQAHALRSNLTSRTYSFVRILFCGNFHLLYQMRCFIIWLIFSLICIMVSALRAEAWNVMGSPSSSSIANTTSSWEYSVSQSSNARMS